MAHRSVFAMTTLAGNPVRSTRTDSIVGIYVVSIGLFLFSIQDILSISSLAGIALLVGSNLYILRRELVQRKRNAYRKPRIPHR